MAKLFKCIYLSSILIALQPPVQTKLCLESLIECFIILFKINKITTIQFYIEKSSSFFISPEPKSTQFFYLFEYTTDFKSISYLTIIDSFCDTINKHCSPEKDRFSLATFKKKMLSIYLRFFKYLKIFSHSNTI